MDSSQASTLSIRVRPGASRNRVGEFRDGVLRVSVTAPPRDGRANAAVLELLAGALGVPRTRLRILRGHSSRDKVMAVDGVGATELTRRLEMGVKAGAK